MKIEDLVRGALAAEADRDRLPAGFASRVVAELPARRPARRWWPLAAASVAVVVIVVALVSSQLTPAPLATPSPNPTSASSAAVVASLSPSPSASRIASASPAPSSATRGADGVPLSIDGVPVLRGAAIATQVHTATDDSSFLIGGRTARMNARCPAGLETRLPPPLPGCGGLLVDGALVGDHAEATWAQFLGTPVVLRVHVHDRRAAACDPGVRPVCELTIVPEALVWVPPAGPNDHRADVVDALAGRYDDGLPRSIGGQQVHRGKEAIAFADTAQAGSSFLVTGWVTGALAVLSCPVFLDDSDWLRQCDRPGISDIPGAYDGPLTSALTFRFLNGIPATGPEVFSVHVGDPRASTCKPDPAVCARMMVAERILWAGDSATDPRGLDAAAVAAALRAVDPSLSMTQIGSRAVILGGTTVRLPSYPVDCAPPFPGAVRYVVSGAEGVTPNVTLVVVAATSEARFRVVPIDARTSDTLGTQGFICKVVNGGTSNPHPGTYVQRWLVYDNVALVVSTHEAPTAADRAYLDRLLAALGKADPLP